MDRGTFEVGCHGGGNARISGSTTAYSIQLWQKAQLVSRIRLALPLMRLRKRLSFEGAGCFVLDRESIRRDKSLQVETDFAFGWYWQCLHLAHVTGKAVDVLYQHLDHRRRAVMAAFQFFLQRKMAEILRRILAVADTGSRDGRESLTSRPPNYSETLPPHSEKSNK
jgi:hypothetical protein